MFQKPLLIIVSAPSGAGKSTLCNKLLKDFPELLYSVSCTTRKPRGAEQDGVAYYFLSDDEFLKKIENSEFLEHAVVHGNRYGTLRKTVEDALKEGKSLIMDIDVEGASQVRRTINELAEGSILKEGFVDIFITIPSIEELEARLIKRGEDALETIKKRINNAKGEIARSNEYKHIVVNNDLETAYAEFKKIICEKGGIV